VTRRVPAEFVDWPDELGVEFGPFRAVCKHHVDGDTFDFVVDQAFNSYPYLTIRLLGVDTPETNHAATRDAGLAAKGFVVGLMPVGTRVILRTRPDPDSFGRYLARVQLRGGFDLTTLILNAGHGVPR
jgi:endonuclease YncB( thermonuclease family)